jgi:hypothetical protein
MTTAVIGNLMLHTIENRNTTTGFDSDEMVQCVSFLADLFFRPKTHQNQLGVFACI